MLLWRFTQEAGRGRHHLYPGLSLVLLDLPGRKVCVQGSLGYAAGKEQSPRGQEKKQSAKPQASERPGKERMEERPGTDWIEGHRCHCSPLEEQLW